MGKGRWEKGDGKREMGKGRWEKGNGKWEMSNELKAGDVLELSGKSEFVIEEGKIKSIRDYSTR